MTIEPVSQAAALSAAATVGSSGDVEALERVPDNEAAEMAKKAPLASYQGTQVDVEA